MSRRYSHSRQTLSSMSWMTFLIEVLCALVILVVSLEMVGRKHCSWRNLTGRNHTLSGLVTGVARCRRCCLWPLHDQPIDLAVCDFILWGFVKNSVYVWWPGWSGAEGVVCGRCTTNPSTWQCVISSCGVSSGTMFTSHHFQRHHQNCERASTPQSGTSHKICLRGFGGNGSIAWTSAVSHVGRT